MLLRLSALASAVAWCATPGAAQIPLNGDQGAILKMEAQFTQEETKLRVAQTFHEGIMDRAVHFAKSKEKQKKTQEFIERGSLMLPDGEGVIEQNKDAGVQVIDPRTPKGFGNPFFRKIHVEENLDQRALISEALTKAAHALGKSLNPDADTVGWRKFWANGAMSEGGSTVWNSEFLLFLFTSPNQIIRRTCMSCSDKFQEIYYRRKTEVRSRELLSVLVNGPFSGTSNVPNQCGVDFDLYSTYADAIAQTNKWRHCSTNNKGMPGNSGPENHSDDEFTCGSGCQPDYAYYVEEGNWLPIAGAREFHLPGKRDGERIETIWMNEFKDNLEASGNGIVRRMCSECSAPYDDIYYRRYPKENGNSGKTNKLQVPDDLIWTLFQDFNHEKSGNIMGVDFDIFSTLEDAVRRNNAWEYCAPYTTQIGFPAKCGPDYATHMSNQWQKYSTIGNYAGGKEHTGFYVQNDGTDMVKFKQEWMSEDEEMMAFLYPDEYGETDDLGVKVCHDPGSYGTENPQDDIPDSHNGWYDVTRCGKCNDYCRWVPLESTPQCPPPSDKSGGSGYNNGWNPFVYEANDDYAGWYDVDGCGECNYYCRWVSFWEWLIDSGGNPSLRTTYGDYVWWDCAPAGTNYHTMDYVPEYFGRTNYWGETFKYGKCSGQGASSTATTTSEGIDPRHSTVGEEMQFSCIMSGSVGGTEAGHFDEFEYQKCSGEGADTPTVARKTKFIGCYVDNGSRPLPHKVGSDISYDLCESTCRLKGYHYFGRQWHQECWCGALTEDDESYKRLGELDVAACNYCEGDYFGGYRNCVYQVLDQFDAKAEWKKHECSHIPIQDTRKQCYVSCRDEDKDVTNKLVCTKLKRTGMEWLAKEVSKWLDSPVCGNKDCSTNAHPLGKDVGNARGTF